MTQNPAEGNDPFRKVRNMMRLQRAVLPDRAVQLLANEVVTRLADRLKPEMDAGRAMRGVPIDDFCRALMSHDGDAAMNMVRQERLDGMPMEAIYLSTLAAAAERLGEWWIEDRVSFPQMSVAAGRIFEIMRHLRRTIPPTRDDIGPERQALFATVPGELHTMGATMAADLFRNRGWEIDLRVGYEHEELMTAVAGRSYRVIGLSAGGVVGVVPLARCVVAFRITHPTARIFVSGAIVTEVPGINDIVGADGVATQVEETVRMVTELADRD